MKIGGIYFSSNDEITSNQLMDAFGSLTLSTGDYTKDPVQVWQVIAHCMIQLLFESVIDIEYFNVSFVIILQLESVGEITSDWFNGTVSVDQTVGNKTSFVIIYEKSDPIISIQSPSGSTYSETEMSHDIVLKTVTLNVPGTAEV